MWIFTVVVGWLIIGLFLHFISITIMVKYDWYKSDEVGFIIYYCYIWPITIPFGVVAGMVLGVFWIQKKYVKWLMSKLEEVKSEEAPPVPVEGPYR